MVKINKTPYPVLSVDTQKLRHNVEIAVKNCDAAGIQVAGVIKGFNGIPEAAQAFIDGGCSQLATSRMDQIIELKEMGVEAEFLLVRIPMISEAEEVAYYADLSLQSEIKVLEAVNKACEKFGKKHGVILMADLGDLREGFWDKEEMVKAAVYVETQLKNIDLKGIGVNLGCYGSIKPTVDKMEDLIAIAE
ncbi:MAG: alanine racemase, partial [Firmicutes bacterium]|nr:alanine racemase [Bacillota bacterium]